MLELHLNSGTRWQNNHEKVNSTPIFNSKSDQPSVVTNGWEAHYQPRDMTSKPDIEAMATEGTFEQISWVKCLVRRCGGCPDDFTLFLLCYLIGIKKLKKSHNGPSAWSKFILYSSAMWQRCFSFTCGFYLILELPKVFQNTILFCRA